MMRKIEIEIPERDYRLLEEIGDGDPTATVKRLAEMAACCVEMRGSKGPSWATYWLRDAGLEVKPRSPRLVQERNADV